MTTANELREMYLEYFEKQCGHTRVASSPIVPPDDPTMLFTSAGMVQFKPLYAGTVDPLPYTRATSCQKCLRAGGKQSDLENVGKTLRHHTFFEMLGNFSFGDYFKLEALQWGWDFIWNHMKLPKDRLWATIFEEDDEAEALLEKEIGIDPSRIIRLDAKENFWGPAGDTGACGPCSEICFFMGTDAELEKAKTQDKETIAKRIVEEGDLFLEIWNMVFPQFDQQKDGSRKPLKNRGIDTGAGLERMTTALNFVETNGKIHGPYETDLLKPIITAACDALNIHPDAIDITEKEKDPTKRYWINAVADHVRALTFALSEGIVPSNDGRGYVLRRILRRASRFGYLMEKEEPFLYRLVDPVINVMGGVYPELKEQAEHVTKLIHIEEERFMKTLAQGTKILDEKIDQAKNEGQAKIEGDDIFLLHATYGFPVDMTAEIAEDAGLSLDREGYQKAMKAHQEEAKKSWKGAELGDEAGLLNDIYEKHGETEFLGYETIENQGTVIALIRDGERVEKCDDGQEATLVLDQSCFYAESGGQVGDKGIIESESGSFEVTDTQKTPSNIILHRGKVVKGSVEVSQTALAHIKPSRRMAIMRNHTVTHLLQAALKQVVGKHITQAGSWVGPEGMRFDFSHSQACTQEELAEVERLVNKYILTGFGVKVEEMPIEKARERGAIAPFGEKYGHQVRVVQVGDNGQTISIEFCGGTHLDRVDRIGSFRLTAESSVAAGIRRIEGCTGQAAYESWAGTRDVVSQLSRRLAVKESQLLERVSALQDEIKKLNKDIKKAKQSQSSFSVDDLLNKAEEVDGIKLVTAKIEDGDPDMLRQAADQIRDKAGKVVCLLGTADEKKVSLICAVSKDETKRIQAGKVIKEVAQIVGGGGGGRPDLAQAGGKQPEKLDEAIEKASDIIKNMLQ